jgi:hypothetical protein
VRTLDLVVPRCPRCGRLHHFGLTVTTASLVGGPSGVVLFGGASAKEASQPLDDQRERLWDVLLRCPDTEEEFTHPARIETMPDEDIIAVAMTGDQQASSSSSWQQDEFTEWIKASVGNARDFARTMLSTSLAAIPVFFTVLKYLGFERVRSSWWAVSIVPPLLLLAAAVAFVYALRPVHLTIADTPDFVTFRTHRLAVMNQRITVGMSLFLVAVAASTIIFLAALRH